MHNALVPLGACNVNVMLDAVEAHWELTDWTYRDVRSGDLVRDISLRPGPWYARYLVVVESVAQLRLLLPLFSHEGRAREVTIIVEQTLQGTLGYAASNLQSLTAFRDETVSGFESSRVVQFRSNQWIDIHEVLSHLAGKARLSLPLQGLRVGVTDPISSSWVVGDPLARWVGSNYLLSDAEPVDSLDLTIRSGHEQSQELRGCIARTPSLSVRMPELPPVDPFTHNPSGFEPYPKGKEVVLRANGDGKTWTLSSDEEAKKSPWISGVAFSHLGEAQLAYLRHFKKLRLETSEATEQWDIARMLSQLATSGIPLATPRLSREITDLLGINIVKAIEAYAGSFDSPAARESASINCRREALREFLPTKRIGTLRQQLSMSSQTNRAVSIVLSTRRPAMLPAILSMIENQSWPSIEVILVLHGVDSLSSDAQAALKSFKRPLTVLEADRNVSFGQVLNIATKTASSDIITKMDDDDFYGPHHLEDLLLAREYSGADLVGSPVEFTYISGVDVTTRRSHKGETATNHVAGGTLLFERVVIEALGGWRQVPSAVDRGLLDSVLAAGGQVYRNHGQNYMMHRRFARSGELSHTWDADTSVFFQDCLDQWDGFTPPPQLQIPAALWPASIRIPAFRSWFSGRTKELPSEEVSAP